MISNDVVSLRLESDDLDTLWGLFLVRFSHSITSPGTNIDFGQVKQNLTNSRGIMVSHLMADWKQLVTKNKSHSPTPYSLKNQKRFCKSQYIHLSELAQTEHSYEHEQTASTHNDGAAKHITMLVVVDDNEGLFAESPSAQSSLP